MITFMLAGGLLIGTLLVHWAPDSWISLTALSGFFFVLGFILTILEIKGKI